MWRQSAKLSLVKNSFLAYFVSRTILAVTDHIQQHISPDFSRTTLEFLTIPCFPGEWTGRPVITHSELSLHEQLTWAKAHPSEGSLTWAKAHPSEGSPERRLTWAKARPSEGSPERRLTWAKAHLSESSPERRLDRCIRLLILSQTSFLVINLWSQCHTRHLTEVCWWRLWLAITNELSVHYTHLVRWNSQQLLPVTVSYVNCSWCIVCLADVYSLLSLLNLSPVQCWCLFNLSVCRVSLLSCLMIIKLL